jgi:uncharacterized membrane protein YeiB
MLIALLSNACPLVPYGIIGIALLTTEALLTAEAPLTAGALIGVGVLTVAGLLVYALLGVDTPDVCPEEPGEAIG